MMIDQLGTDTRAARRARQSYLRRLRRLARARLSRDEALSLEREIADHIDAAVAASPEADRHEVTLAAIRALGDPDEIVGSADDRAPGSTVRETIALLLLTIGSVLIPVVGWLIGVAVAWTSQRWSRMDKLLATLAPPGGLAIAVAPLLLGSASSGGDGSGLQAAPTALVLLLLAAHVAVIVRLARAVRR